MTKLSEDQKTLLDYLRNGKPLHICIDFDLSPELTPSYR